MSECDGRPSVQVEPSPINRMVTASAGVQTDLSSGSVEWFSPHVDLFGTPLNHKVPLYVSPVPDQNAWDIDALNINWSGLTAYAYPPTALLHRVIQTIRQSSLPDHCNSPRLTRDALVWDLVQLSTEIPLQLSVSRTLLKQTHNYVFHSNPQHLNLHTWHLGVYSSKNKVSLWRWLRELLPLRGHQQGPSTSQSGPYLRNGAEKVRGFLNSLCEASLRLLHVPVPGPKQAPFDH